MWYSGYTLCMVAGWIIVAGTNSPLYQESIILRTLDYTVSVDVICNRIIVRKKWCRIQQYTLKPTHKNARQKYCMTGKHLAGNCAQVRFPQGSFKAYILELCSEIFECLLYWILYQDSFKKLTLMVEILCYHSWRNFIEILVLSSSENVLSKQLSLRGNTLKCFYRTLWI